MAIISIANQKGGVGKSTTVINLAAAFALKTAWLNRGDPGRILVIDMDPQCNTYKTFAGGIFSKDKVEDPGVTLADYLGYRTNRPLMDAILTSDLPHRAPANLDFLFTTPMSMKELRDQLAGSGSADAPFRLREILAEVSGNYENIFIDTGPASDWLTTNALVASTDVLFPIEPAGFSIQGIEENFAYVEKIQRYMNGELGVVGILPSRFHTQYGTQQDIINLIRKNYPGQVFPVISERATVYDAVQAGLDVFSYKPARASDKLESSDPSTLEFANVADELSKRLNI